MNLFPTSLTDISTLQKTRRNLMVISLFIILVVNNANFENVRMFNELFSSNANYFVRAASGIISWYLAFNLLFLSINEIGSLSKAKHPQSIKETRGFFSTTTVIKKNTPKNSSDSLNSYNYHLLTAWTGRTLHYLDTIIAFILFGYSFSITYDETISIITATFF